MPYRGDRRLPQTPPPVEDRGEKRSPVAETMADLRRLLRSLPGVPPRDWVEEVLGADTAEFTDYAMPLAALLVALDAAPAFSSLSALPGWSELREKAAQLIHGDCDYAGMLAEQLMPPALRHRMGMHITAPDLADFVLALTRPGPYARLLDPACGGGMFLLRAQAMAEEASPLALTGVDCSPLAIRLARRNLAGSHARLLQSDFFQVAPKLGSYDVIVGNLPYVRQEFISDKVAMRSALATIYATTGDAMPVLPARGDLHVYFWAALLPLLVSAGRAALLTSASWLDVDYGAALRTLLLERCSVRAVIESRAESWFGEASVRAAITLVQHRPCETGPTRFVTLKQPLQQLLQRHENAYRLSSYIEESDERDDAEMQIRLAGDRLLAAAPAAPWGPHRRAPRLYFDLMARSDRLRPLSNLTQPGFGLKSGANNFFYLTAEEACMRGIPSHYLRPIVKSLRDFESIQLDPMTIRWRVLMVDHDERTLEAAQEHALLEYLQLGMHLRYAAASDARKAGIPATRPTCRQRRRWYTLRSLPPGRLIMSMVYGDRYLVGLNDGEMQVDAALYRLLPGDPVQIPGLAAVLNSAWGRLAYEVNAFILVGRLDVAQMKLTQLRRLPVVDPAAIPATRWQAVLDPLCRRPILHTTYELAQPDREELDDLVLYALGYTSAGERTHIRRELYAAILDLVAARMNDEMVR